MTPDGTATSNAYFGMPVKHLFFLSHPGYLLRGLFSAAHSARNLWISLGSFKMQRQQAAGFGVFYRPPFHLPLHFQTKAKLLADIVC